MVKSCAFPVRLSSVITEHLFFSLGCHFTSWWICVCDWSSVSQVLLLQEADASSSCALWKRNTEGSVK